MQPSGSIIVRGKEGWHGTGMLASPSSQPDASQILYWFSLIRVSSF
jgi:hypothetical protein